MTVDSTGKLLVVQGLARRKGIPKRGGGGDQGAGEIPGRGGEGRAFDELATAHDGLSLQWLEIKNAGERFAAYQKLTPKAKDTLAAHPGQLPESADPGCTA